MREGRRIEDYNQTNKCEIINNELQQCEANPVVSFAFSCCYDILKYVPGASLFHEPEALPGADEAERPPEGGVLQEGCFSC